MKRILQSVWFYVIVLAVGITVIVIIERSL
jgi:hypothetical protein